MPINMQIEYPKLEAENIKLRMINDSLLEALKEHHTFLSLLIGSSSLERIERFDLLEKAKELFHKAATFKQKAEN